MANSNNSNMSNQQVIVNKVDATKKTANGVVDKAREFIHEAVKTPEMREEERRQNMTIPEKISEAMPNSPAEAAETVRSSFNAAVGDIKKNFKERLDEGTENTNKINYTDPAAEKEKKFQPITDIREKIYDATKSEEERKAELGFFDQIKADTKELNPVLSDDEKKRLP